MVDYSSLTLVTSRREKARTARVTVKEEVLSNCLTFLSTYSYVLLIYTTLQKRLKTYMCNPLMFFSWYSEVKLRIYCAILNHINASKTGPPP